MKLDESTAYTAGCFRGEPASCSFACPVHLDVRSFLEKASKGRWSAGYKTLRDSLVFPVIASSLCDEPCRACCQRTVVGDEAIAIRDLEAACIRLTKDPRPERYAIPPKTQRIAVVGAGIAGLSCALSLAQKRFLVTVFDKEDGWGGSLRSHPRWAAFDADMALQFSAVDVEFRYGTEVKTLDELAGFDAVYVATGAGGDAFGLLEGWSEDLLTTSAPKVFMGGALVGAGPLEGIAQGVEASKIIEVFLQTGRTVVTPCLYDKNSCGHYLEHPGATSAPRVEATGADGYTDEEARVEASRCFRCNCDNCMAACEMLKKFRKDPTKIAVEVYADMGANPPSSVRSATREVYSCNICGHCRAVCPENVDIGALLQFSRAARMSAGIQPAALHDFWLREMDFATSEGSFSSAPKGRETCDYAFYPGCQLGASNPAHLLGSYALLSQSHDAGIMLGCCGAPAFWAGDETRLQANIEETRRIWLRMGKPTLIFACATCSHLFRLFLPEIPRVSLYELLAESQGLAPAGAFSEAAMFDPCAARDDNEMQSAVRKLAATAGVTLEELKERNRCCGYGGHMRTANPDLYEEIVEHRAEASPKPYVVYCANCKEVFASRGKECAHILDIALGLDPDVGVPTLQQKRDNSLGVKRELMKQMQDADFEPERHPWDDLTLAIGADVQKHMDEKLISEGDLKEAIWLAESSGDKFCDESEGVSLCSMVKPVITYWVQYRPIGPNTYEILNAYYHRMRLQQGEQSP